MQEPTDSKYVNSFTGLGFSLNGVTYFNGSTVLRTDIGEGDAALLCTTDRVGCCRASGNVAAAGQFYFPNDTQVSIAADSTFRSYYRNRGARLIRLNRRPNGDVVTGEFRCEIPDASGTLVNFFVNIGVYI